jgi:hypothetical protein
MRTYSLANLSLLLATVGMVLATIPATALAQRVSGTLGVAAIILPPDGSQAPRLISVSLAPTGVARVETASPIAGAVSQIVMVTVSSPTNNFAPIVHPPVLVLAPSAENRSDATTTSETSPARRQDYSVDLRLPPDGSGTDSVSVRITYLIVPGT